jgi:hypothetical protein
MVSNAVVELLDIEYAKGQKERQGASVREEGDLKKDKWRDRDIMRISRS